MTDAPIHPIHRGYPGDVIQLDPEHSHGWGPLLCIVDEHLSWGVLCYALHAEERDKPPSQMYLRVKHGGYVIIGQAEWIGVRAADADADAEPDGHD